MAKIGPKRSMQPNAGDAAHRRTHYAGPGRPKRANIDELIAQCRPGERVVHIKDADSLRSFTLHLMHIRISGGHAYLTNQMGYHRCAEAYDLFMTNVAELTKLKIFHAEEVIKNRTFLADPWPSMWKPLETAARSLAQTVDIRQGIKGPVEFEQCTNEILQRVQDYWQDVNRKWLSGQGGRSEIPAYPALYIEFEQAMEKSHKLGSKPAQSPKEDDIAQKRKDIMRRRLYKDLEKGKNI